VRYGFPENGRAINLDVNDEAEATSPDGRRLQASLLK
jgi:hypothetical protein